MRLSNIDNVCGEAGGGRRFFLRYLLFFILLIFCIFQFNISKIYGFSFYPDEFGYWASAAAGLGYDWSETASLGSYYSFGYSLILMPILSLFHNSIMAYRAAVTVNMLLQCAAVGMLWEIFKRRHSDRQPYEPLSAEKSEKNTQKRKNHILFAVGCTVFYPVWTFYAQTTLAEALLAFLYVLICYQLILFLEKPKIMRAIFLTLSFVYLYFVHMRTIGVVTAGILTLSVYAWRHPNSRKSLLAGLAVLALGAVCGSWVKGWVTDNVYSTADFKMLAINDYGGQIGKIKGLFTLQGIWKFFLSCVGKLYYLGIASFGLIYPAIYECFRESVKIFRRIFAGQEKFFRKNEKAVRHGKWLFSEQNENTVWEYFCFFCITSLTGQFLITAISAMSPGRLDAVTNGRYNEYILPIFLGIGLLAFCEKRRKRRDFLISAVFSAVLFGITYLNMLRSGLTVIQGYFTAGLSYLSDDWHYDTGTDPVKAFLLGILLMAFIRGCLYAGEHFSKYISGLSVMGAVLAAEILLTICLQKKYIWLFNDVDYYNLQIYEYIEEYEAAQREYCEGEGSKTLSVSYLYGGGLPYIDLLQFAMRDKKIEITAIPHTDAMESGEEGKDNHLPQTGFLIVDSDYPYCTELEETYQRCVGSKAFILYKAE